MWTLLYYDLTLCCVAGKPGPNRSTQRPNSKLKKQLYCCTEKYLKNSNTKLRNVETRSKTQNSKTQRDAYNSGERETEDINIHNRVTSGWVAGGNTADTN